MFDAYPHVVAGAQRVGLLLARGAADRGWTVTIVTPNDGPFVERCRAEEIPSAVVQAPRSLLRYGRSTTPRQAAMACADLFRYWARLRRWITEQQIEVVHVHDHRGMLLAGAPARMASAKVVWHVHALDANPALNAGLQSLAHVVVVPAAAVIPKLRGIAWRRRPTVVTYPLLRPQIRRRDALPTHTTVTAIGRLHPDKGIDVLLHAISDRRDDLLHVRFKIVGGRQRGWEAWADELRALAIELDLDDEVDFLGEVEDIAGILAETSLLVQPSRERTEILPFTIIEAMAAGVAVLTSDVGGVADLVDGANGVVVPAGDVAALGDALVSLTRTPRRLASMGAVGRSRVESHCQPGEFVDTIVDLWSGLADRPR